MNSPEHAFLQAVSDAQVQGASKLRLVTRRDTFGVHTLRNKVSHHSLPIRCDELAAYLELGARVFEELQPVGFMDIQLAQFAVDAEWRLETHRNLQQLMDSPKHSAILARCDKHLEANLKAWIKELGSRRKRRIKSGGDVFDLATCEGYQWYNELSKLALRLVPARLELERKSVVRRKSGILRLVESLTPESIATIAEAQQNGILTGVEETLFTKPAR